MERFPDLGPGIYEASETQSYATIGSATVVVRKQYSFPQSLRRIYKGLDCDVLFAKWFDLNKTI